jgi:hypothetical protein
MISKVNGEWIMQFSQANCYREHQYKANEEYNANKIVSKHNNMKKITVKSSDVEELVKNFADVTNAKFPIESNNWKLNVSEVMLLLKRVKHSTALYSDWFVDYDSAFLEDDILVNSKDEVVVGTIIVSLRDPQRKEVVISFGQKNKEGKFIATKSSEFPFNHLVFLCGFEGLVQLKFDCLNKVIHPQFDANTLIHFFSSRPTSVIVKRKFKGE